MSVVTPVLTEALRRSLSTVPRGKRGVLSLGVSQVGADVALGWKPRQGVTVAGYAARYWQGGWMAGAKGEWVW